MAFASTITGYISNGDRRGTYGTWTTDTTGGNIDTGLTRCDHITIQTTGDSVSADQGSINETLPLDGSAITIAVTSDADGNWEAWGI